MIRLKRKFDFNSLIKKQFKKYKILHHVRFTREIYLLMFFGFLFFVLILRLFYLQMIKSSQFDNMLNAQHVSESLLKAQRGSIYVSDKSGKPVKLTENITMYDVFVDPKFIGDKQQFIDIITPVIYKQLCESKDANNEQISQMECVQGIEYFTQKDLLPKKPEFFYYGSGKVTDGRDTFDWSGYNVQVQDILSGLNKNIVYGMIKSRLNDRIQIGIKKKNYVGFFANTKFIQDLKKLNLPCIDIQYNNYVYIVSANVSNVTEDSLAFEKLLDKYGYLPNFPNIQNYFIPQENRYVKLITNVGPDIAQMIKDLQLKYYRIRTKDNVPILHGLGLEPFVKRYYPYGGFLSNVVGFLDKNNQPFYGIEQYFDDLLRGKDGKIIGRSASWLGQVGANEFEIEDAKDGDDVYLTVDIGIQREIESIIKQYQVSLKADSISVLVYDPFEGQVKADVSAPSFNPNDYNAAFTLQPLSPEYRYILDNDTYIDVPVYTQTGGSTEVLTYDERKDINIPKYIAKNIFGPQVLVDKNVSMVYEPGSIFKAFTVGIGIDTDEVRFYDFYNDPGVVDVGPFKIKNADNACMGESQTFLHAFVRSCNVGMVRIAQKLGKDIFYNYVQDLGFGQLTNIELANEEAGFVEGVTTVSMARFYNNTFGQGLLATPLQMAVGYGALVNGGYYVKPTILAGIYNNQTKAFTPHKKQVVKQIFRPETSKALKEGLFNVIEQNPENSKGIKLEGYTLGGKSGTSQISFKGKYQQGNGWTNTSFVGLITKENPKYIVIVQVRRPRNSQWGAQTAGKIFKDIAQFIVSYSLIEK